MTPGEIRRRTLSELRKARKDMMSAAWLKGVQELPEAERTAAAVAKLEVSLAVRQLENAGLAAIGQGLAENEDELQRGLWTAPASGRWSYALTVVRTDQRRTVLMPDVVLDLPDLPAGWDVTIGSRHATLPRWPVTLTAPAAPAPGVYDIPLVARDDIGPAKLTVRVTVPE